MRLLVFPASLGLGGSQLNAIDLARAMGERGHDVWIFGPDGPLRETIDRAGIAYLPAPERPKLRPSPGIVRALTAATSRLGVDVVHGYEWPPILEATYGPYLRRGTAVVGTIMSMGVAPFIPSHLPLIVGTAQIADAERRRRDDVTLLEPPVDTKQNAPWAEVGLARAEFGAAPEDLLVVVVSRLARELKREGLLESVRAAGLLAPDVPIRLLIVGDGPARDEIEGLAAEVNSRIGRDVVTLTGAMSDPRIAYAAADVALGMGSSALRAMAFAKPTIVQGERGFWRLLTPQTLDAFLYQGWYGVGDGSDGAGRLAEIIRELSRDAPRRADLGLYARTVVDDRFSLDRAADLQEEIYVRALRDTPRRRRTLPRLVRPLSQAVGHEITRRYARLRGTAPADDFNALTAQPS